MSLTFYFICLNKTFCTETVDLLFVLGGKEAELKGIEAAKVAKEALQKEEERLAAEIKAVEEAKLAAEEKAIEMERLAKESKLAEEKKRLAEAQALKEEKLRLEAKKVADIKATKAATKSATKSAPKRKRDAEKKTSKKKPKTTRKWQTAQQWEVANCAPTYRGSMSDPSIEWELCSVLSDMNKRVISWDLEIKSDKTKCFNVPRQFIREVVDGGDHE